MGASQGKGKNDEDKNKEKEIKNEKKGKKDKEEENENNEESVEESNEDSEKNEEEKKSKKRKKTTRESKEQEKEKEIKPLKTETNNKEDSSEEDNSSKKSESNKNSKKEVLKDFSQEENNEEKESKNSSKSKSNGSKEEKEENEEKKADEEKENKSKIKNKNEKKEYKDVLPGEIPEERKVSNPNKLPFKYNCCQTIELAHKMPITAMAYILRRNEIATSSVDETIKIWKINIEKKKISLNKELKGHTDSVLCIKDFPKLQCFCSTSSDNTLKLWNCNSLKCMATLSFHTKCVLSCCYNSLGKNEIFSGGEDLMIVVWTTEKEKDLAHYEKRFVLKGHKKRISALAFAEDYDYLISGSDDKTLRIWDMNNFDDIKCIKLIKDFSSCIDYLLYLNNRLLASCEDGLISFIKMNKMKRCRSVKFSNSPVYSFNIFHKHKYLLVGSKDGKARIWKIGTNKREVLVAHTKAITGITNFEEDFIITTSIDCSIKLWKKE